MKNLATLNKSLMKLLKNTIDSTILSLLECTATGKGSWYDKTGLRPEEHCLDLCCGTGDIAREVLRQYPASKVTGLDFSQKMLNIAKSKNSNNSGIQYLLGNAMEIPFPDTNFDAVTIGYGLRKRSKPERMPARNLTCAETRGSFGQPGCRKSSFTGLLRN